MYFSHHDSTDLNQTFTLCMRVFTQYSANFIEMTNMVSQMQQFK